MNQSMPKAMLKALLFSYLLSGLMILALSFALYKWKLREPQINAALLLVQGAACLAGGFAAGKAAGSRRFLWGLFTGLLYFAVLFGMSVFLAHGSLPDTSRAAAVLACCCAGGILGGILS